MKKYLISLLILLLLTSTSFVGVSYKQDAIDSKTSEAPTDGGLMNSSWPMFHHDVRHTGRSPYGPVGNWPLIKWKFQMEGQTDSSPALDKNVLSTLVHKAFMINFSSL